jgi:hypothetical protein
MNKVPLNIPTVEISPFDTRTAQTKDGPVEVSILIPECCREGWANCPHVVRREKPAKKNIGL